MRHRLFAASVCLLLILGLSHAARAQSSLADLAKQEEQRRKSLPEPAKVYTNKDLNAVRPSPPPAGGASPAEAKAEKGGDKTAAGADKDTAKKDASKDAEPAKDKAYWAGRLKALQEALERNRTYAEAMQTRINALTTDFVNRDDPAQRGGIERDRQKTLAELNRLKQTIQSDT